MFSGFYLPLFAILVALILRGVALEYRGKRDEPQWRDRMDLLITIGSVLPAVLWGVAFANIVRGVPLDADHEYVGSFGDLLNPFALLGGVTFAAVFVDARRDLPGAAHHRRPAGPRQPAGHPGGCRRRGAGDRLPLVGAGVARRHGLGRS